MESVALRLCDRSDTTTRTARRAALVTTYLSQPPPSMPTTCSASRRRPAMGCLLRIRPFEAGCGAESTSCWRRKASSGAGAWTLPDRGLAVGQRAVRGDALAGMPYGIRQLWSMCCFDHRTCSLGGRDRGRSGFVVARRSCSLSGRDRSAFVLARRYRASAALCAPAAEARQQLAYSGGCEDTLGAAHALRTGGASDGSRRYRARVAHAFALRNGGGSDNIRPTAAAASTHPNPNPNP